MKPPITKIVSGGQTGADRAGLDWAIENGVPHGGWCPKGRRAEDGVIPTCYMLVESPRRHYEERTEWNVRDTDGTVILTLAGTLTGGSKKTAAFAKRHSKPITAMSWLFNATRSLRDLTMHGLLSASRAKDFGLAGSAARQGAIFDQLLLGLVRVATATVRSVLAAARRNPAAVRAPSA